MEDKDKLVVLPVEPCGCFLVWSTEDFLYFVKHYCTIVLHQTYPNLHESLEKTKQITYFVHSSCNTLGIPQVHLFLTVTIWVHIHFLKEDWC